MTQKNVTSRVWFAGAGILLTASLLVYQLFSLQIDRYAHYATLSAENHLRLLPLLPVRGSIYDRNGEPLAFNRTVYKLEVNPDLAPNPADVISELVSGDDIDSTALSRFKNPWQKLPNTKTLRSNFRLSEHEVARLAVRLRDLPGVSLVGVLDRHYPHRHILAHVIGYMGGVNQRDIRLFGPDYRHTYTVGKVGIERKYEKFLHGNLGVRRAEVNAQGHIVRTTNIKHSQLGSDLMLAIDTDLQRIAYDALGDNSGAVVALDPRNGDVLALVSKPSYDPNVFVSGRLVPADYRAILQDPFHPLFNRAVSGQYAPGSTVKPVVALAGLEHALVTPKSHIFAGPYYTPPNSERKFRDWREDGHGWVNMRSSIAQSCDVFFYDLAYRIGINRLAAAFKQFGLGAPTRLDFDNEASGLVPTREWKKQRHRLPWFPEETVNTGIGQGFLLTTPLQLSVLAATLANRGTVVEPRLVRAMRQGETGWKQRETRVNKVVKLGNKDDWDEVIAGMVDSVHRPNGTSYKTVGQKISYVMAGKTGTSQTFNLAPDQKYNEDEIPRSLRDHSLFIGFAPLDNPVIAVAVIAEHAGSGARVAAPIARDVINAHLHGQLISSADATYGGGQ